MASEDDRMWEELIEFMPSDVAQCTLRYVDSSQVLCEACRNPKCECLFPLRKDATYFDRTFHAFWNGPDRAVEIYAELALLVEHNLRVVDTLPVRCAVSRCWRKAWSVYLGMRNVALVGDSDGGMSWQCCAVNLVGEAKAETNSMWEWFDVCWTDGPLPRHHVPPEYRRMHHVICQLCSENFETV